MAIEKIMTSAAFWDFVNQPGNANRYFERINQEIVEHMPSNPYSSQVAMLIGALMLNYVLQHDLGMVTGEQGGYDIDQDNTFAPDAAFVFKGRQQSLPKTGFNPIPPDLVVEVVSPSDLQDPQRRIWRKLAVYRANQVPLIWYVYTDRQEVAVYRPGQAAQTLSVNDTLDGEGVLHGFRLPIKAIFP
jgi:Uma2 family endonuclease